MNYRHHKEATVQEKVEKKPSTVAKVARGLGLKRNEKDSSKALASSTTPVATVTPAAASAAPVTTVLQNSNNGFGNQIPRTFSAHIGERPYTK